MSYDKNLTEREFWLNRLKKNLCLSFCIVNGGTSRLRPKMYTKTKNVFCANYATETLLPLTCEKR